MTQNKQLTIEERYHIQVYRSQGVSLRRTAPSLIIVVQTDEVLKDRLAIDRVERIKDSGESIRNLVDESNAVKANQAVLEYFNGMLELEMFRFIKLIFETASYCFQIWQAFFCQPNSEMSSVNPIQKCPLFCHSEMSAFVCRFKGWSRSLNCD